MKKLISLLLCAALLLSVGGVGLTASASPSELPLVVDNSIENGTVTADRNRVTSGDIVTLTVTPDPGATLSSLTVIYGERQVETTAIDSTHFSFVTPEFSTTYNWGQVGVTAIFRTGEPPLHYLLNESVDYDDHVTITTDPPCARAGEVISLQPYGSAFPCELEILTMAHAGDTVTFTMTPDAGYVPYELISTNYIPYFYTPVGQCRVDLRLVSENNGSRTYAFTMPDYDVMDKYPAEELQPYNVNVSQYDGGAVTSDRATAFADETVTLTVTADPYFELDYLDVFTGHGSVVTTTDQGNGVYTFTMPADNVDVKAGFRLQAGYYRVSVSQYDNGTVTSDYTIATENTTVTLTVTPDTGYELDYLDVFTDHGVAVITTDQGNGVYTFTMPADNVYVKAGFRLPGGFYSVTVSQYDNGTVTSDYALATENTTVTLTVTPDAGYELDYLDVFTDHGAVVTTTDQGNGVYTFTMPADNVYVKAGFRLPAGYYRIEVMPSDNGTVTSDYAAAPAGTTVTLTTTPDPGYYLDELSVWTGHGVTVTTTDQGNGVYTFTMPADDVYVGAKFKELEGYYRVNLGQYDNGTVTTNFAVAPAGATITLTVTPDYGYYLDFLDVYTDHGVTVTTTDHGSGLYSFIMPADNVSVKAIFKEQEGYRIYTDNYNNGTVTSDYVRAPAGTTVTLTVTPSFAYELDQLTVNNNDNNLPVALTNVDGTHYTFVIPAADVRVEATFTAAVVESSRLLLDYTLDPNTGSWIDYDVTAIAGLAPETTVPVWDTTDAVFVIETARTGDAVVFSVTPEIGLTISAEDLCLYPAVSDLRLIAESGNTKTFSFTMPNYDVHIKPSPRATDPYYITVTSFGAGTAYSDLSTAYPGETVTVYATPSVEWAIDWISVMNTANNSTLPVTELGSGVYTFLMPEGDANVDVQFYYHPHVWSDKRGAGRTTVSNTEPEAGETVTITCIPEPGASLLSISAYVTDGWVSREDITGDPMTLTQIDAQHYSITMPGNRKSVMVYTTYTSWDDFRYFASTFAPTDESHCTVTYTPYLEGITGISVAQMAEIEGAPGTIGTRTLAGETVTYTVTPDAGYALDAAATGWIMSVSTAFPNLAMDAGGPDFAATLVSNNNGVLTYSFVMPDYSVCFTPTAGAPYSITIDPDIVNGTLTSDHATAIAGETVTITATPNPGDFIVQLPQVTEVNSGDSVFFDTANDETGVYSFTMPADDVFITWEVELNRYPLAITYDPAAENHYSYTFAPLGDWSNYVQVLDMDTAIASNGDTVTFITDLPGGTEVTYTVTPDAGYVIDGDSAARWIMPYLGYSQEDYPDIVATLVSENGNAKTYSFTMPYYDLGLAPVIVDEIPAAERNIIVGTSLTLNGTIGVNAYVRPNDAIAATGYARITGPNGFDEIRYFNTMTPTANGYKFTVPVYSVQMAYPVSVSVFDAEDVQQAIFYHDARVTGDVYNTSVAAWCDAVLSHPNDYQTNLYNLAAATRNYGACAQPVLTGANHYEEDAAALGLTAADLLLEIDQALLAGVTEQTVMPFARTETGTLPDGVSDVRMSLVLLDTTSLRIYFRASGDLPTVTVDGSPATPVADGGYYYVEVPDIAAPLLDTTHTICIGDSYTTECSALSYAYRIFEAAPNNAALVNLAKALYNYNVAANAFFNA